MKIIKCLLLLTIPLFYNQIVFAGSKNDTLVHIIIEQLQNGTINDTATEMGCEHFYNAMALGGNKKLGSFSILFENDKCVYYGMDFPNELNQRAVIRYYKTSKPELIAVLPNMYKDSARLFSLDIVGCKFNSKRHFSNSFSQCGIRKFRLTKEYIIAEVEYSESHWFWGTKIGYHVCLNYFDKNTLAFVKSEKTFFNKKDYPYGRYYFLW